MAELFFKEHPTQLPVINFDGMATDEKPEPKRHGTLLPNSVRAIVCGPSNCGKTNAVLALLTHSNGLRFANLYVYSKSLNQPKYTLLKRVLDNVEGVDFLPFAAHEQVISPDEARPESVILFDDVACEKQDHIRNYFCVGAINVSIVSISVRLILAYRNIWFAIMRILSSYSSRTR